MRKALPHQEQALEYCRQVNNPALFMEMRLGKTKVVIDWLRPLEKAKVLVVAPITTLRASWARELELEGEPKPALLLGTSKERMESFSQRRKWNLINYEGLLRVPDLLSAYRWQAIVLDESTRIKNPQAQITKLLNRYAANANQRCILTGYPDPEGPLDFFEQFRFLHGGFLGFSNFWTYRAVGFFPLARAFKWVPKPTFAPKIKAYVRKHSFVLSRKDVGLANRKIYETRSIQMPPEQKRLMKKLEEEFLLELPSGEKKQTMWAPVKYIWMARLAGGYVDETKWFEGKFQELRSLLSTELKDQQVVVWFRFNAELRHAQTHMEDMGIESACIDGTTREDDRARIRKDFMERKVQILLLQQKVGMFGLDLSTSSTAIYFSNGHSSESRVQSEDRIEHPTKKEPLLIIDLVAEDSVDEDILAALKRKKSVNLSYLREQTELRRKHAGTSGN